jgi:hypothetical protein
MNFQFSKDYQLLWELAQKQRVICTNGKMLLTAKTKGDNIVIVENDGGIWSESDCKHHFKGACEHYDIQFLIPGEVEELVGVLKEVADCEIKSKGEFAGIHTTELSRIFKSGKIQKTLKKYEVKNDPPTSEPSDSQKAGE